MVPVWSRVYVLPRVWEIHNAPSHFGLLGNIRVETGEIEYRVWLEYEEGDERGESAGGGVEGGGDNGVGYQRAAKARGGGRQAEGAHQMRGAVRGEQRRGADFRGERQRDEHACENRIRRAPPPRDANQKYGGHHAEQRQKGIHREEVA